MEIGRGPMLTTSIQVNNLWMYNSILQHSFTERAFYETLAPLQHVIFGGETVCTLVILCSLSFISLICDNSVTIQNL